MKGKANRVERTPSDKNAEDLISDRSPGQGLCSPPIPEVCRTWGGGEEWASRVDDEVSNGVGRKAETANACADVRQK